MNYTYSQFLGKLHEYKTGNISYTKNQLIYYLDRINNDEKLSIYNFVNDKIKLNDMYDFLLLLPFGISSNINKKIKGKYIWEFVFYSLKKELPNIEYNHIFCILKNISECISEFDESKLYFNNFQNGEERGKILYQKIKFAKNIEDIKIILRDECIYINNVMVSEFSKLWWEQGEDYLYWLPREIHDDILELCGEKYDYSTLF